MSNKNTNKGGLAVYTKQKWEMTKTLILVLTWIILGAHLEIVGPTLDVLKKLTSSDYTGISTIFMARGAGYMFANILGAIIQNVVKKHSQSLLVLAFFVATLCVIATPFITNLYVLMVIFFFQGISQGVTDLGGTNLMLTMWKDNAGAPLNMVHLGYGIGAVFANLFVKMFIKESSNSGSKEQNHNFNTSYIRTPYMITSFLCLIITIVHLILVIIERRRQNQAADDRNINYASVSTSAPGENKNKTENVSGFSPKSCGNGYFFYGLSMSSIWIFYMFFLSGNDQTFGKFFFVYLKSDEFKLSTHTATWGMIIYWLSYSVGRLICALVTLIVSVHFALCGLWVCGFVVAIAWFVFVWNAFLTTTSIFVLGAFTGLVFSPTFPLSFAFINQRLNATPLFLGLSLCGAATGAIVFQKIAGYVMDKNRKHFPTLLISCMIMSVILFVLAFIISTIHKKNLDKRLNNEKRQNSKKSEEEIQIENELKKTESNTDEV